MDLFLFYRNRSFICLQGLILSLLLFAVLTVILLLLLLLLILWDCNVEGGLELFPGPKLNEECLIPLWPLWLEVTVSTAGRCVKNDSQYEVLFTPLLSHHLWCNWGEN